MRDRMLLSKIFGAAQQRWWELLTVFDTPEEFDGYSVV